jgi:lipopolysaccharide transport system permease protein/teichoic acid transport system permease protein
MNRIKDLSLLFLRFVVTLFKSRALVFNLAYRDIRARYLGSYLNFIWPFVQPTVTILLLWFVFEIGFRSPPVENYPFVLWLITGIIPWFFFSEALGHATNSILDYSYLVKKVVFKVSVIPIIKIISALFIHLFFVIFIIAAFFAYGFKPRLCNLQVFYYLFATLVLLVGISWITSSLIIFARDVGQLVAMILQFGFWFTPIIWNIKMVPEKYQDLMKLNPVYYITEGYRNSFISGIWFWEYPHWTLEFWMVTGVIFIMGAIIFLKLRPHFADVL